MKKPLFIFKSGELKREDNTILFISEESKKVVPINSILEIHIFGEIDLNKRFLELMTKNQIPIFFYNYYEYYIGGFYPRDYMNSGTITVNQVKFYIEEEKRLFLAKSFVLGGINNIVKNLSYYKNRGFESLKILIESIENKSKKISEISDIPSLMSLEGEIRKSYYNTGFNEILRNENFFFDKRTKRPPENPINALISFGNSLIYNIVLSEIYRTHLDPRIGYLHQANNRSFSLNLDISEVFKPIIVDRIIFSLINKKQLHENDFDKNLEYCYLKDKGKQIFIEAFNKKLETTFDHKNLGNISYRKAIRLECYKLYKHILEEDYYSPFLSEW